jgi:flavodoxin
MNLQITGSWYIQVISIVKPDAADTDKKFFRVMCRCIPANLVDDYDFEGEELYPSDCIDIRDLLSWTFDVVSPVEMYTEDEMDEQLARSDAEYEQGYFDWWGVAPRIIETFLESYDFSGKKIVPFCSHEGSGLGGSIRQIKMAVPDANLTAGVAIHGATASHCDREVNLILSQAR